MGKTIYSALVLIDGYSDNGMCIGDNGMCIESSEFKQLPPAVGPDMDNTAETEEYLKEPCIPQSENPLWYWKKSKLAYPTLANMAKHALSVPASSAPVECLFSIAGKIFQPDRCRMKDATFEQLILSTSVTII